MLSTVNLIHRGRRPLAESLAALLLSFEAYLLPYCEPGSTELLVIRSFDNMAVAKATIDICTTWKEATQSGDPALKGPQLRHNT